MLLLCSSLWRAVCWVAVEVLRLVERFERETARTAPAPTMRLKSARVLDPLFKALGWILTRGGYAEAYKDVIPRRHKGGRLTKAPTIVSVSVALASLCRGQKTAVNIKDDASPAFQLRRYAWSAKLPLRAYRLSRVRRLRLSRAPRKDRRSGDCSDIYLPYTL